MSILSGIRNPISLVILGLVGLALIVGTFTLLMTGRPVPGEVWVLDTAVIMALYGHGSFLAQSAAHQLTVGDLLEAVTRGATAATPTPSTTNGGGVTGGKIGSESGGQSGPGPTG